ncbi:tRNA (adenosine(37)-N6)-dimethylallyltransferase MiaA [Candidatus Parcubacteria bacterium]|nr:tRNA (adenosine(37)-N6)-dimethylallyltransferase MiaA [Candidatus Parcubacteria bacterium]
MGKSRSPKLIAIVGPTASGKTAWALELAREFNAEIISADSRQIYRELTIGTSKPRGAWQGDTYTVSGIPYHLVDCVDLNEEFTLAQYQQRAWVAIDETIRRGKAPFLVGGTGLYIYAVVDNLVIPAVEPNQQLRARLAGKPTDELAKILRDLDPVSADAVDPANPRRLIRAIEVALGANRSFAALKARGSARYETLQIGITKPKEELCETIERRVDEMIEEGFVNEVESLLEKYRRTLPALSGIGYTEIIQHLDGAITLEKAIRLIKTHTRQYARRQMTWFRRDKRIRWVQHFDEARALVADFLG